MTVNNMVRRPQWLLNYGGRDITADISSMLLSLTYTDYLDGLSGEIEIEVEDGGGLWQGPWFPTLGDELNLMIGYEGDALLSCGDFQIDEIELSSGEAGGGDVITMRGLSAYVTPAMRTAYSAGYEGQSLVQIARTIAGRYGMQVVYAPEIEELSFARVTQKHESDLAFLSRLAREHGYEFSVRGTKIVFYPCRALADAAAVVSIDRSGIESFELRKRSYRTYRAAEAAYQDPFTKKLIAQSAQAADTASGDHLKLVPRCENGSQAALKAQAALASRNRHSFEGILRIPGSTAFSAGLNVILSEFGEFDGIYMVVAAVHKITRRGGYSTEVEIRRAA